MYSLFVASLYEASKFSFESTSFWFILIVFYVDSNFGCELSWCFWNTFYKVARRNTLQETPPTNSHISLQLLV
jgi:hypothetical protein